MDPNKKCSFPSCPHGVFYIFITKKKDKRSLFLIFIIVTRIRHTHAYKGDLLKISKRGTPTHFYMHIIYVTVINKYIWLTTRVHSISFFYLLWVSFLFIHCKKCIYEISFNTHFNLFSIFFSSSFIWILW